MPDAQLSCRHPRQSVAVRVWDIPVRVVHWLVVLLVMFSWITAKSGRLRWHEVSGYAILVLVVFRIYWGFVGSESARFARFLCGLRAVWCYVRTLRLRDAHQITLGHNPLGGWNVIALILVLLVQAALGLFTVDVDGLESGPLAKYVSFTAGRQIAALHQSMFNLLLLLIGLHIAAVFAHLLYRRENLVAPMWTGIKRVPCAQVATLACVAPWRAWAGVAGIGLLIWILAVAL